MVHHIYALFVPTLAHAYLLSLEWFNWYNDNTTYIIKKSGNNNNQIHIKTSLAIPTKALIIISEH